MSYSTSTYINTAMTTMEIFMRDTPYSFAWKIAATRGTPENRIRAANTAFLIFFLLMKSSIKISTSMIRGTR